MRNVIDNILCVNKDTRKLVLYESMLATGNTEHFVLIIKMWTIVLTFCCTEPVYWEHIKSRIPEIYWTQTILKVMRYFRAKIAALWDHILVVKYL